MSSKTSMKRFWHFIILLALIGTGFGCGSGGGGGNGGGGKTEGPDTTPPQFIGLNGATSDNNGNVVLTSPEATDDRTAGPEMSYLIYVATSPDGIQRNGTTPYTFTGANACANGQCTFTITDLKKDGTTTYFFGSDAKDAAGNLDGGAHPNEAALKATPLAVSPQPIGGGNGGGGGGIIPSSSLNVNPALHAAHPSLAVVNDQRYVIWEECTPAPNAIPDPADPTKKISTPGWAQDHPCSQDTASKVYVRRGANWDLLTDPTLGGRTDLSRDPARHSHSPTIAFDGTNLYTSWLERGSNLFVLKFDGASWTDTGFPNPGADRPALTRHPILGSALGIGYEFSPNGVSNHQLFFRQFNGSWQPSGSTLNKNPNMAGEAPIFSKKGDQLYVTWKEATQASPTPSTPNVFVKRWNGSAWEDVGTGAALNMNPANEARFPSIDVSGSVPYVAWHECSDTNCSREHIFVKHFDGTQWIQDRDTGACGADPNCGSLNVNSRFAKTPSLAVHNDKVYVAWSERDFATNKFVVRIKRLDGTTWTPLTLPQGLFVNNAQSPMLFSNGSLHIAWVEENDQGILQLIVAKLG